MTTRCVSPQLDFSTVRLSEWVLTSLKTLECSNAHSTLDTDTRRDRDAPLRSLFSALTSVAFGRRRRRCLLPVRCGAVRALHSTSSCTLLCLWQVMSLKCSLERRRSALCALLCLYCTCAAQYCTHCPQTKTDERTNERGVCVAGMCVQTSQRLVCVPSSLECNCAAQYS